MTVIIGYVLKHWIVASVVVLFGVAIGVRIWYKAKLKLGGDQQ